MKMWQIWIDLWWFAVICGWFVVDLWWFAVICGDYMDRPLTLTACGPSDDKEVKDVFGRPGARVGVGSAR